jgi:hypothetical protein
MEELYLRPAALNELDAAVQEWLCASLRKLLLEIHWRRDDGDVQSFDILRRQRAIPVSGRRGNLQDRSRYVFREIGERGRGLHAERVALQESEEFSRDEISFLALTVTLFKRSGNTCRCEAFLEARRHPGQKRGLLGMSKGTHCSMAKDSRPEEGLGKDSIAPNAGPIWVRLRDEFNMTRHEKTSQSDNAD